MTSKRRLPIRVALVALHLSVWLLTALFASGAEQSASSRAEGYWEGDISLPGSKLAVQVDLRKENAGVWIGTIDIPAQGLRGFKLGAITVEDSAVGFEMPGVPGGPTFAGKLDEARSTVAGEFKQSGQSFPFLLARKEKPAVKPAGDGVPAKTVPGAGLAGFWLGTLKVGPVAELRLSLEVTSGADGRLEGVMVSMDQGNARIPLMATLQEAHKVKLELPKIGGSFEGSFNADGSELSGEWQQGGQKFPLTFKRLAKAATLNRPQEPKRPYPYIDEEVIVDNRGSDVKLAGTLTLPRSAGPHPAVVLITGSGPQDRDESLMGHRPFLVLADHLTRQGIAVLRYDDRGVGKSTGKFEEALHTDFVEDALAAVAFLKARKEIDAKRIGLIGHSEGGIVAPLAAAKQPMEIAFVVMLAGVGVPMQELLIRQASDVARVLGMPEDQTERVARFQREWYPRLIAAADTSAVEKLVREMIGEQLKVYSPEQLKILNMTEGAIAGQVKMVSSPWFRKLIAYDPRPTLREVKCPVLAINGEKDVQVAAKENLEAIRAALVEGGNADVKIVAFPDLNHLFQSCATGAVSEYGQIEETFAPVAKQTVAEWIRSKSGL